MNKNILFIIMALVCVSFGQAITTTFEYYDDTLTLNQVQFLFTANESVNITYYISTDIGFSNIVDTATNTKLDTLVILQTDLTPATRYYAKVNGTSSTNAGVTFTTGNTTFITDDYKITGASRTLLNLFTLIVLAIVIITQINIIGYKDPKHLIIILSMTTLAVFILSQWIAAILGL